MADKAIDSEGKVYERGGDGIYRAKMGLFGQAKETDWLGRPRMQRDLFGNPKVKKNWLGEPVRGSSEIGFGGDDLATAIVGWGLKAIVYSLIGVFRLIVWGIGSLRNTDAGPKVKEASPEAVVDGLFVEDAKRVLSEAADAARQLGAPAVEPVHLLMGIVEVGGRPAEILAQNGLTPAKLKAEVQAQTGPPLIQYVELGLSQQAKDVIEAAEALKKAGSASRILPEHLLLSLLENPEVKELLIELGASVEQIRIDLAATD